MLIGVVADDLTGATDVALMLQRAGMGVAQVIGVPASAASLPDADAVVVATMGHGDEEALAPVLELEIGYVGLVASARRAKAVLASLRARGVDEEALARVRSPAGLDLGPSTQAEIAVAVLAELVAWRHERPVVPSAPMLAVDPVCGMEIAAGAAKETAVHEGQTYFFCCAGCRSRFEADPARYVAVETP